MSRPLAGEPEVVVWLDRAVGRIRLNRPRALNALTLGMCRAMLDALLAWRDDPAISAVILDHGAERGFCAGADIRTIAQSVQTDGAAAARFFRTEYQLNHLLFTYPKPIVAFMDGIVMGGGAGLALPCRYRVATERTLFAMPETAIGFFPDVGGSWFLPRMPGGAGFWLGLTGARIRTADCLDLGIATHSAASDRLETIKASICERPEFTAGILGKAPSERAGGLLGSHRHAIDTALAEGGLPSILGALDAGDPWSQEQADLLRTRSPLSLCVTLRALRTGATLPTFAEALAMEFTIASRLVHQRDFAEGVRAAIIDKDNAPAWSPQTLDAVSHGLLDGIFAPLPPEEAWTPLENGPSV